jgi:protein-disulfide isomerase
MHARILLLASLTLGCASHRAAQAQHREVMDALAAQREALAGMREAIAALEREQLVLQARTDDVIHEVSRTALPRATHGEDKGDAPVGGGIHEELQAVTQRLDALQSSLDALRSKPTGEPPKGRPDPALVYKMTIDGAHARGPATAKVTIVACSDFQCPFCARVEPTLDELAKMYGDELRIVFKHNPLPMHNRAHAAAIAAEAAGKQGKFWEMHAKLFANARDLTDENFIAWAGEIGLDVAKFERDLGERAIADRVRKQSEQCMQLGARGTPSFFVNGRFLSGAQPVDAFSKLIDEEAAKADVRLRKGTSRKKLYDATIKAGKTKV